MSDINNRPVSLPAGSFDVGVLGKGLEKAAKGAASKYEGAVEAALAEAGGAETSVPDKRDIPGYVFQDVENKDLGITEQVQVYKPRLDPDPQPADAQSDEAAVINSQAEQRATATAKATK